MTIKPIFMFPVLLLSHLATGNEFFENVPQKVDLTEFGVVAECASYEFTRGEPVVEMFLPIDINEDQYTDFLILAFCSNSNDLSGIEHDGPAYTYLIPYLSDSEGNYTAQPLAVFGEAFPKLDYMPRKWVQADFNDDGRDDVALAINTDDGRLNHAVPYQVVLMSQPDGRFVVDQISTPAPLMAHAISLAKNSLGGFDVLWSGYSMDGGVYAYRYVNSTWTDVTTEYPNAGAYDLSTSDFGTETRAVLPLQGETQKIVSMSQQDAAGNPIKGMNLWQRNGTTWTATGSYGVSIDGSVERISWVTQQPAPIGYTTVNGKELIIDAFTQEGCIIQDQGSTYFMAQVSGTGIVGQKALDKNRVYGLADATDEEFVSVLMFLDISGDEVVLSPLSVTNEQIIEHGNFFDCRDVNGDGLTDVVMHNFANSWRDNWTKLQTPYVYLNNGNTGFSYVDYEQRGVFANEFGEYTGILHDMNGDGIEDLVRITKEYPVQNPAVDASVQIHFGKAALFIDTDGDGIADDVDPDADGDGILNSQELIDGTDPFDVDDYVQPYPNLGGKVYHWSKHALIGDVAVERLASGPGPGQQAKTNAAGQYELTATLPGSVALAASRAVQATDLNRTITSADALAALKIAVGLNPNSDPDGSGPLSPLVVSPYQLMAADMNGDGRVTSADALAILKVAVGLSDALAPSWALVPDDLPLWDTHSTKSTVYKGATDYSVSYPDKTQVNFTAVLVGDVNASWSSDAESVDDAYFMALSARYQQAPELWHVRDTDADGLSDTQESTIGTNAFSRDTDDDGIPDGQDIAPLDKTEGLDTDLDGIGNNADPDDDNDGIPDGVDLFPLDPLESADTDLDGIGDNRDFDIDGDGIPNEIDTDPFVSGRDSDGDGIVDSLDPMPNDPSNFTDTDGDGVFDFYDADPTDPAISTTIEFDFSQVAAAGVSERIANTEQPPQGWLGKVKIKAFELFARLEYWLLGEEAMAQTAAAQLLSQTNLISWDASGDEVANAILSDDVLFVAEAVLTPKGDYLYLLTAPEIQRSLISQMGINAQPDRCQLYRVDLQTQGFECVLDDSAPTINPVVRTGTWRDDYLRSGITFRADGVAILETAGNDGPMLLYPNGEYQIFGTTAREAPAGYFKIVENVVWLDDNHIGVSAMFPPNEGGATQTFWSAFNINTGEEVAEVEGDNFRIVVHDQTIYTAGEQFTWTGTEFAVTGGGSAIQDKFGNLWQKDSVYGRSITDQTRGLTLSMGDEGTSGPNIYMGSGTGTGIVYRDYDFAEDWVISKYSALARDTILTLEGEPYALREQMYIPLSDGRGALIKLTDPDLWYYLRNGNETGDVDINYTVRTAAGSTEDRVYTIPFAAIQSFAAYDATIYDASSYANGYELLQENGEGVALELPNPEAEQSTFCVFQISTATQRCADLADYRVLKNDYETIRNNVERHFPADYYACPDQECQAVPGVQNVVFGGRGLLAFFKDSTDNQYYKAEANIEDFMLRGDDALTITPVVNGAGESEIIALTANVKPSAQKYLAGVIATYDKGTITIDFAQPMSGLVAEPDVTMKLLDTETRIDLASIKWNADRTGLILQVQDKTQLEIAEYELEIQDWLFTNNSALRAVLAEPLLLNMTQALITEDIDTDGDGIGNKVDEDDDGDGVADTNDVFPLDGTETVDFDGDGTGDNADNDDDNDGLEDGADAFPFDATEYLDTDGDGTGNNADTDDDNDTVEDANDAFPLDPAASVDTDNDGAPDDWNEGKSVQDSTTGLVLDTDDDNDGTLDEGDAFPLDASESRDTDLDGTGDNADTDDDNDGVEDANDAFPLDPAASVDTDADGLPDDWNEGATAADSTTNLTVDDDDDGDGVADSEDEFPLDPSRSIDTDGDGIDNAVDDDDDNDGVEDANDAFPLDPAASVDTDADGLPDAWNEGYTEADSTTGLTLDLDANGNGVPDSEETGGNGGAGDLILYYDGAVGADWDLGLCVYDIAAEQETCFGDAPSNDQGPVTWVTVDSGDATRGTALSLTFNPVDDAVFYIQSTDAVDISAFADGGVLSFDLNVSQGVYDDGFMFKADCFWPCTSNNITLVEPALTPGEWIRVEYPVADLEIRGLALDQVSNGIAVFPHVQFQQGKSFEIANIRYTANSTEALSRDFDADGVLDREDAFPNDPAASIDTDQDGLPDDWNPGFGAADSTTGLSLDIDDDGDGVLDTADVFPLDPFEFADFDLDGIGDNADRDDDNDFIPDGLDDFPFDPALGDDSRLRDLTAEPAEAELASIDGKVVDGYVSGAFVFLDLNFNGEHDTNEPSAVTDEFGDFNLKLDGGAAQCESLAPVVVDVPVGAIDSEQGEVLEAYQMIAPPLFASQYLDSTNLTLSPLTSVLWSEIKSALGLDKGVGYSCQALVGEISQQESIKDSLSQAITNIVRHYNLTEAQIYADFIAEGDGFAKQQALDIVKALKKSFAATAELRAMMPAASWASVTYYKFSALDGDDLYPNAWYRETNYKDGQLAVFEVVKVSDDLQTDVRLIIRGEREFSVEGDLQFQREREYESRGGDQSTYSCNDKESVSYTAAGVEYQLQNLASQSGITDSADCSFTTFAERTQGRYLFIRVFHDDGSENGAQFSFDIAQNGFSGLENWVDFIGRGDQFAPAELQAYISQLPYQFCQTELAGATFVNRSRSVPGQDYNLVIDRANDGSYQIRTDYPDGRSTTETFAADAIACADYDIDLDGDGLANSVDDDIDGDGVANVDDLFPADSNDWADSDGDGVGDNADAFPNDSTEYRDSDGDGIGNNQDDDNDNDGILDVDDAFPLDARYSADTDRDGVADDIDNDSDNDSVPDNVDLFPTDPLNAKDFDGDGIGDNTDIDDDNDGVEDALDAFPFDATESADTDGDGVGDNTDLYPEDALESADTDGDGVGDNADAYPLDPNHYLAWANRNYLADSITRAQAATIRITSSTGVLISPKYAITAAHSPLDGNNEITPNLVAENAWGEKRAIVNVFYDVARDFAIVELESPYEKFGTVPIATERSETGSEAFIVGNPAYVVAMGLSRAVSFGTVTNYLEPDGFERFSDFHAFGGYSGSGVYNDQGELVGILSMAGCCDYSPYYDANLPTYNTTWDQYRQENIYAIPMEFIKGFLEQYQVQPELVAAPALPKNKLDPQKRPLLDADELARLEPILSTARQATVALWARPLFEVGNYSGNPNCTGALVAPTIVFTAAHCVEGRANFTVAFTGREIRYARVLETSPGGDVAILEMDEPAPEGYPMMEVATEPMQVGDIGLMVGHPRDQYYEFGGWIVSTIKAYTSDKGWASFWGHSGKGSSGGPLINEQGQIVGVLTAGSSGGDFPIGSYDNEYLYDIQDPHLQDTSPWPSPFSISFQSFAGNIEEHASLAYDYLTKDGVSRLLGAKAFDSAVYEWRETHIATGREGAIVRKDRDTLTPDANFGVAGTVTLPTQDGLGFVPRAVEQDASGRIWALVDTAYQATSTLSLAQLDATGAVLQTHDWAGPYVKGRAIAIEGDTVFVGGEQMGASDRDVVLGRCDVSAVDWVCTDLAVFEHDGQDYAAGLAVTPTHLVLGGFVDRHEPTKNTDFAALYVNKDTLEADLSVGDTGLVYLERERSVDDSERVFDIQSTSDGGVMLVGSEWVPFVSANLAVKLTPTGEVDTSFGEQGVFRTYNTPYHLKGLAQLNTVIETNDYYVFVGSQNFNGYIGWGLYNRNIDERKNVLGRDNDLTMVIANKDGTLADIPNPVVYWDGQAQEYLVSASERDGAIELLYREEFGNTLRRFVAPIMADKELNYLDPSITNTPVRFHNEGVERGSNQAEIICRKQDQQGTNLSIEFSYSSFSDKDDLVQVLDEYWLVNGQRLNQRNYLYGRRQDLDVGEYQYFMSYEDGRGNIEQIQTLPFNYQPERCLFRP